MSDPQAGLSRRGVLAGAAGVAGILGATQWWLTEHPGPISLLSQTIAWQRPGHRVFVQDPRDVVPSSRVLTDATSREELLAGEQEWRAAAPAWLRQGPFSVLADSAMLDLRVLSLGLPATAAGWSKRWRYVWPRDASTAAAALAVIGQPAGALANLSYLQQVQRADGWFQARYDPLTGKSPDDRTRQLDGVGWALWATDQVRRVLTSGADQAVASLADLVRRSTALILEVTDNGRQLPPAGPDYWEISERIVTLGTVAMLAAGLEAATHLLPILDDDPAPATAALRELDALREQHFAAFPRHADGDDPDVSIVFTMPPFRQEPAPGALEALVCLKPRITRSAGGLAPGSGWRDDGISWTPETALVASAFAGTGAGDNATYLLHWLENHRTAAGSLPEKVLASGAPAAVAPLSWTASLVLLTIPRLTP
ncbi:hypothetical protein [Branchiibius hedensis]|uniref:hypothetical protein n=1 Tax=Branchiibius hedensis TaxID=672460 RepID=UPI000D6D877F|nr:hypothetical protein [Branchiibius hedensis]